MQSITAIIATVADRFETAGFELDSTDTLSLLTDELRSEGIEYVLVDEGTSFVRLYAWNGREYAHQWTVDPAEVDEDELALLVSAFQAQEMEQGQC